MNLLKRIRIENIKGKDLLEVNFTNFTANQPNIIVAPNGYGKSTIATAFKASVSGRMKLEQKDIYQQNIDNHPKLEIELWGDNAGVYTSTDADGQISANMSVYVINSPLYAKSTTKHYGQRTAGTADLRIENVVIFDDIPERISFDYSYRNISRAFGEKGKLFLNISDMLSDYENLSKMLDIKESLKKCITHVRIKNKFNDFLDFCQSSGTTSSIKNQISGELIDSLRENDDIATLLDCVNTMNCKPEGWSDVDRVFTAIQICKILEQHYTRGDRNILKKIHDYLEFQEIRHLIDERLNVFNTTGRNIRTQEERGKLVVKFDRAEAMSNGERDVLSFIVNLSKFEKNFKKQIGILVIDEVFDYLDGSNMLAVQYYLVNLIERCKEMGKVLFPIIFTHLDPAVFSNYYFNKKKIHYISFSAHIDLESDIVKMLRLREDKMLTEEQSLKQRGSG